MGLHFVRYEAKKGRCPYGLVAVLKLNVVVLSDEGQLGSTRDEILIRHLITRLSSPE